MDRITRRAVVGGLVGAVAGGLASSASAQFNFLNSLGGSRGRGLNLNLDRIISGASSLFEGLSLDETDEIRIGNEMYGRLIERSGGIYRNSLAQQALADFARPLFATSRRAEFRWEINIVSDDTVNAWALPGGKLAVNAGLLRYVQDEHELSAVIAHEMGHVEFSHALEEMRNEKFTKGFTDLGREALSAKLESQGKGGLFADEMLDHLEGPMLDLIASGYSRAHEDQADDHILTVYRKVGLDPARSPAFFRTLLQIIPKDAEGTTSLFNTHPGTRDRIERLERAAASQPAPAQVAQMPAFWGIKATFPTRMHYRRNA